MGSNVSKLNYITHASNDLEREIRVFECSELLNSDQVLRERSFASVYSQICFDSEFFQGENPRNLEAFLNENFNSSISRFILKSSFFKADDNSYDMRRIRLLLFSLTFNSNTKSNKRDNPDKGTFIFCLLRDELVEHMDDSVKSEEKDLLELISELFQIACIEILTFYMEEKRHISVKEIIGNFERSRETIQDRIKQEIFKIENEIRTAITPHEFLQKFVNNRLFLTAGHIRNIAFEVIDPDGQKKPKDCCLIF